jgi:hypothetical protein
MIGWRRADPDSPIERGLNAAGGLFSGSESVSRDCSWLIGFKSAYQTADKDRAGGTIFSTINRAAVH